jgi:hypothetical protein
MGQRADLASHIFAWGRKDNMKSCVGARENNGGRFQERFGVVRTKEASYQDCRRTKLSRLKSELMCQLRRSSKHVAFVFLVLFLAVSSLEFPVLRSIFTWAKETLIMNGTTRWTESSEGVHSSSWQS